MARLKGGSKIVVRLADITKNIRNGKLLKVGFMENATYPDGTSVPLVAAMNEFGVPSRKQPPRPFFRRMIAKHENEWPGAIARLLLANNYNAKQTLGQAGDAIAGQLRQSINDLVEPALSPVTIEKKGFDKPLIDTAVMVNSIAHQVD